MQQLDIFEHSRDRELLNALADALATNDNAGDTAAARRAAQALAAEFPQDPHGPAAALLIAALEVEAEAGTAPLADAAALPAAQTAIEQQLAPAAAALLGAAGAAPWLARRWRALAQRASKLPYSPEAPTLHAAPLWLRGRAWAEAAAAVDGIESWRRRPLPLGWMAEARWHLQGLDPTWPLLAELAWLAPGQLPALLQRLPDPACRKLARRFEGSRETVFNDECWAWWPAWLLVEQPLLAAPLAGAELQRHGAPERAYTLVRSLLHLERQGRHADLIAQRRQLHELDTELFAAYMATR